MVTTKIQLIEELNRVHEELDTLPDRIRQETIYLEDGFHVDTDFLTAILRMITRHVEASAKVMDALEDLLGIEKSNPEVDKKKKEGKKWDAAEVLRHCTFSDGVLRLPDVQLNPKSYAEVKKWITEAGGSWQGGKVQGFTFDFDATRVAGILMEGKRCNLQQEFQFFETPAELADYIVSLAGVGADDTVLEPSAGRGAIIKAIHRAQPGVNVDYFELMPENRQFLEKMEHVTYCGEDFTQGVPRLYKRIFANPPFAKNQDVRHVLAMYEALEYNGIMVAITSAHWEVASEKICADFRAWLEANGAEVHHVPSGVFKESGTEVETRIILIKKEIPG